MISDELSERVQRLRDQVEPLVEEAYREGQSALADELLRYVNEKLAEAEVLYERLAPDMVRAFERMHHGAERSPIVEAYFGALGGALSGVRLELEQSRPSDNRESQED